MKIRILVVVISFLLTVLVSCYGISTSYGHMLSERINESLRVALEKTLVDEVFTDSNSMNVKKEKIESVLNKYNQKLNDYISQSDWEPVFLENWSITSIDEISSNSNFLDPMSLHFTSFTIFNDFEVIRADKARKIVIQNRFKLNEHWFAVFFLIVAFVFLIVNLIFQKPLFGLASEDSDDYGEMSTEKLIQQGENGDLEFKKSLRWGSTISAEINKAQSIVIKTIAGFANAGGGTLLIGVEDNRELVGLESDYESLDGDKDKFELHLSNLIDANISKVFRANNIKIKFPTIHEVEICQIDIKPSKTAIVLATKDKHGQKVEKFYLRSGNQTTELSLAEASQYIESNQ